MVLNSTEEVRKSSVSSEQSFDQYDRRKDPPRRTLLDTYVDRDSEYWKNRVELKIDVSYTDHSHIIGKGGKRTQAIMKQTGCHIHFPDSQNEHENGKSNEVTIAGAALKVEDARKKIREIAPLSLSVLFAKHIRPDVNFYQLVQAPSLEKEMGFNEEDVLLMVRSNASSKTPFLMIRVASCNTSLLEECHNKFIEKYCNPGVEMQCSLHVEILPSVQLFVKGYKDQLLRAIEENTNAKISAPSVEDASKRGATTFLVKGTFHSVLQARQFLIALLPATLSFKIPQGCHLPAIQTIETKYNCRNVKIRARNECDAQFALHATTTEYRIVTLYEMRQELCHYSPDQIPEFNDYNFIDQKLDSDIQHILYETIDWVNQMQHLAPKTSVQATMKYQMQQLMHQMNPYLPQFYSQMSVNNADTHNYYSNSYGNQPYSRSDSSMSMMSYDGNMSNYAMQTGNINYTQQQFLIDQQRMYTNGGVVPYALPSMSLTPMTVPYTGIQQQQIGLSTGLSAPCTAINQNHMECSADYGGYRTNRFNEGEATPQRRIRSGFNQKLAAVSKSVNDQAFDLNDVKKRNRMIPLAPGTERTAAAKVAASIKVEEGNEDFEYLAYRLSKGIATAKIASAAPGLRQPDGTYSGQGFSLSMPQQRLITSFANEKSGQGIGLEASDQGGDETLTNKEIQLSPTNKLSTTPPAPCTPKGTHITRSGTDRYSALRTSLSTLRRDTTSSSVPEHAEVHHQTSNDTNNTSYNQSTQAQENVPIYMTQGFPQPRTHRFSSTSTAEMLQGMNACTNMLTPAMWQQMDPKDKETYFRQFLAYHNIENVFPILKQHDVDVEALIMLSPDDMKSLPLSQGQMAKLRNIQYWFQCLDGGFYAERNTRVH